MHRRWRLWTRHQASASVCLEDGDAENPHLFVVVYKLPAITHVTHSAFEVTRVLSTDSSTSVIIEDGVDSKSCFR